MNGRNGRTDDAKTIYIPPTSSGDNKQKFTVCQFIKFIREYRHVAKLSFIEASNFVSSLYPVFHFSNTNMQIF